MDSQTFIRATQKQVAELKKYLTDQAPAMVVQKVYRFIDGNFRAQGWQGASFQKWKANARNGTILVKNGHLRRGFNHQQSGGTIRFYNNVKYAAIHNRGGTIKATTNVRQHDRSINYLDEVSAPGARKEKWVKKNTGTSSVEAHTRKMNTTMPQRQFAPYEGSESPVMNKSIIRELDRDISKILNKK